MTVDDGKEKHTYMLNRPDRGLHIVPGIWRTLDDFSSGAVCLVLASDKYIEADYIRLYEGFYEVENLRVSEHFQRCLVIGFIGNFVYEVAVYYLAVFIDDNHGACKQSL